MTQNHHIGGDLGGMEDGFGGNIPCGKTVMVGIDSGFLVAVRWEDRWVREGSLPEM